MMAETGAYLQKTVYNLPSNIILMRYEEGRVE